MNPLLAAAAKKPKSLSNGQTTSTAKRRYNEQTPGGLLIVRDSRNGAQTRAREPSAGPSNPPAKKFKANPSGGLSVPPQAARNASVDPVVEKDVQEMQDEADRLRRASRANTTIDPSLTSMSFRPSSPAKQPKPTRAKKKKDTVLDTLEPVLDGTPQAERNKILRGDAMAAIARDAERGRTPESDPKGHRRRSSLGGRGKRASTSYNGGVVPPPHAKVDEESFYKHIDRELSDSEQLRVLLMWSASRAANSTDTPKLSPQEAELLKGLTDDVPRMLADRLINLSLYAPEDQDMDGVATGENAQNEKNKRWVEVYSQDIKNAEDEAEEWKRTEFHYEEFIRKERRHLEERKRAPRDASPDENALDERFRRGLQLARAGPSAVSADVAARLPDLQFKLDTLHTNLHAARTFVRVAERTLDARFGLLSGGLAARAGTGTALGVGASIGGPADDSRALLRALSVVDKERPAAKVPDAVQQARREVQRAARAGDGERRLTLPSAGSGSGAGSGGTPRRPGTPRRERTPGR
ncbi:Mis12-Mtw1 protein family-domain-containing protein [Mycena crocata]|nr:Mis12-Mtw1 protein family-domain-containing protein [Mycena crocata]